jgi:Domain of unknown function (DUF1707)
MSSAVDGIRQWCRMPSVYDIRDTRNPLTTARDRKARNPVNAMTGNYPPAAMRASDADRDGVLSDLSGHFQAGRLTSEELDERTGRALAARTWGALRELLADLPADRSALRARAAASSSTRLRPPSGRLTLPFIAPLVGIGIAAVVLVNVAHGGWGLIWLLPSVLLIARRLVCYPGASHRCGQQD